MENQLTVKDQGLKSIMANDLVKEKFREILGKNAPAFISSVTTIGTTTALQYCEPKSVLSAAIAAASLNLQVSPSLGFAAIIPYGKQAQFQIMTKGLIQLALRSGQFRTINVTEIYEGELKNQNRLTGEFDFSGTRTSDIVTGYAAYFQLINGFSKSLYMTIEQVTAHGKKFSKTFSNTAGSWHTNFEAMARKTVLKLLLSRFAPLSTEMQIQFAVSADQSVVHTDDNLEVISFEYPDGNGEQSENSVHAKSTIDKEKERIMLLISDCKTMKDLKKLEKQLNREDPEMVAAYTNKADELAEDELKMEV